ncbi:hypothetical protein NBRC10512_005980 [Rhodotorula toruloides]
MLLYAVLATLLTCSGIVSAAPAPDTGGAASSLDASSKASVATVAYQEICYLTLFDAEDITSLKYGKDTLAQDENGQDVYINDGYKKDSSGKEYYYEEACYKSSKVDGKTQSNTVASSSTTDSRPFSSLIGTLGLDDGVSGFLSGLTSGDSLGLRGLVRFVKRQFDSQTIGAILGQPAAADPAASSSSSAAPPIDNEDSATPSSPDYFDAPSPTPTPTLTTTAAPSPTAIDPLEIANGFGGIQSVGNALPGRVGAEDILGPAFSSADAGPTTGFAATTTDAGDQATQAAPQQTETPDAQPSTSAFTPAPGPPGYPSAFAPAAGSPGSPSSFTPADGPPSASPTVAVNPNDDAAPQPTQFQPASSPPVVPTPLSTFTPAASPPTTDIAAPATTQQVQPAPSSPDVQTAAPPVDSAPSFFTPASSVVTPTILSTSSPVIADTPTPAATSAPSSTTVDTPASSSTVPLRIYVAAASPTSSSVDAASSPNTSLAVVSLAPTARVCHAALARSRRLWEKSPDTLSPPRPASSPAAPLDSRAQPSWLAPVGFLLLAKRPSHDRTASLAPTRRKAAVLDPAGKRVGATGLCGSGDEGDGRVCGLQGRGWDS